MRVATFQTVEDGAPREQAVWTLHRGGRPDEYLRIALVARLPRGFMVGTRLVMRLHASGDLMGAIEAIRIE